MRTLEAKDGSRNFIWDRGDGEALEARYVVRDDHELICYLSSQTACGRACRMCHLTRTGQVRATNATVDDFRMQARQVIDYAMLSDHPFEIINYNFMARGEPLDNPTVHSWLLRALQEEALVMEWMPKFKISTIMPTNVSLDLVKRFAIMQPDIYYSLYSVNPDFRKRWFPKAVTPEVGLAALKQWQDFSHKIPRIHLALIKNENDSEKDLVDLVATIQSSDLRVDFNIVRYNPYDDSSQEGNWERAESIFTSLMPQSTVQVIQRVGYEAKASCGMFVS